MIIDHQRFDGKRGTHLASSAPIRDAQGEIIGAVVIALDISEMKKAEERLRKSEEALRKAKDELEDKVLERTILYKEANTSLRICRI